MHPMVCKKVRHQTCSKGFFLLTAPAAWLSLSILSSPCLLTNYVQWILITCYWDLLRIPSWWNSQVFFSSPYVRYVKQLLMFKSTRFQSEIHIAPSGNQTWQWQIPYKWRNQWENHPWMVHFPASHVWLLEGSLYCAMSAAGWPCCAAKCRRSFRLAATSWRSHLRRAPTCSDAKYLGKIKWFTNLK